MGHARRETQHPSRVWLVRTLRRSLESKPTTARPTWLSSSTPSPAVSSGGRSPITCVLSSLSTPFTWPSGAAGRRQDRPLPTAITGRPTPRGPSAGDSGVQAYLAPWDRSAIARQRGRELLRHPPARAARRASLGEPPATGSSHLRMDRGLIQPASVSQLLPDVEFRGLRGRARGMINDQ